MNAWAHPRPARSVRVVLWILASALFLLFLSSLFRAENVPALLSAAMFGIAVVAAWRPDRCLLLVAGIVPIAYWICRRWNGALAWPEAIVVAFLAGYALRRALARPGESRLPAVAIHSLIAVVVASLAVHFLFLRSAIGTDALRSLLRDAVAGEYLLGSAGPELDAAMRLIEGLLLWHAAFTTAAARTSFAPLLIRTLVIGATAAGALNLWRLWLAAWQFDAPVLVFLGYLRTVRYNAHYTDLNAAGSYFMMTLLPALALAWGRRWWQWILSVVCIALSLMLSGSRTAIVTGVLAIGLLLYRRRRERRSETAPRRPFATIPVVIAIAIACVGLAFLLAARNASPASGSVWIRVEFARASLRMLGSAPLFGVGIGQYPGRAGAFTSAALLKAYPPAEHENAHNNFLQVLSELGAVGFAAFISILGATTRMASRHLVGDSDNRLRWAATAGAAAFVLSWLGGHPLLVDAPAFSFWILAGTIAGWGEIAVPEVRRVSSHAIPMTILAIALLASLPFRVRAEFSRAELEHQGIGLSGWEQADDGVRHRLARATSSVFVPSTAAVVIVPLRAVDTNQELLVELRLDNRLADVVRVPGDRWLMLHLPLPRVQREARYLRLDLTVRSALADESPRLRIGKVTPR